MLKIIHIIFLLFLTSAAKADMKNEILTTLNKEAKKVSEYILGKIPGEGITEGSIEVRDDDDDFIDFEILAVRDIESKEKSNLFTQLGFRKDKVLSSERYIGNLGLGYRFLTDDKSMLFGVNSFYDHDLHTNHKRASLGFEAKASMLDFTFNQYQKLSNQKVIKGVKEQTLSGTELNLTSQIPYIPWSKINLQNYRWENEKAAQDNKGMIYSLELALTPSLQFDVSQDVSSVDGQDDEMLYKLSFLYPPRSNKPSLMNETFSEEAFIKENVEKKLKDKVRRTNNLVVEVQGAVIITKK